jgi:peptidoglycan/LPS O-acetylase OafA/YrhL
LVGSANSRVPLLLVEANQEIESRAPMNSRELDGYRFVAFLCVFLFHAGLLNCGYLGVQAFFVLSGFLLTPILLRMRERLPPRAYFVHFYGRRMLRIFPLYYLFLALSGLAIFLLLRGGGFGQGVTLGRLSHEFLFAVTYTLNFLRATDGPASSPYGHLWSLAVEEQFYLLWPLLLFLIPAHRLKAALAAFIILGPFLRTAEFAISHFHLIGGVNPHPEEFIYELPFSHLDAFALGGWMALYEVRRSGLWFGVLAVLLPLIGVATEFHGTHHIVLRSLGYGDILADSYKSIWAYSPIDLFFGFMLYRISRHGFLGSALGRGPLPYLGKISYGLYVWHFPILWVGLELARTAGLSRPLAIGLSFALCVVCSVASYEAYERRLLHLKDVFFPKAPVGA